MLALLSWRVWVAIALAVALAASHWKAFKLGEYEKASADQGRFDQIENGLTAQKAKAAAILADTNAKIIAQQAATDEFKTQLEKAREINRSHTNDIARQLAGVKLRFAAKDAGCGAGSASTASAESKTPSDAAPAVCELSDEAATAIKAIVLDADTLRDDYRLIYDWAYRDETTP